MNDKRKVIHTKGGAEIEVHSIEPSMAFNNYGYLEFKQGHYFIYDSREDTGEIIRFLNLFCDYVSGKYSFVKTEDIAKIASYDNLMKRLEKERNSLESLSDKVKDTLFEGIHEGMIGKLDSIIKDNTIIEDRKDSI